MNQILQKDTETTVEYVLPDYMGDVKKLLSTTAVVTPSGRFINNGEAQFSGIVSYDVYYADSEGKLTKVTATSDYDVIVPLNDEKHNDASSSTRVVSFSIRLTGPRKFIAKAVLCSTVYVSEADDLSSVGDAFENGRVPEVATRTIKSERMLFGQSAEREFAEEAATVEGVTPDGLEILSASGAVRILESRATEEGVLVSGEMVLTAIVQTAEQPPFAIKKVIPFEETITIEGMSAEMQTSAYGYLTSVSAGACENQGATSLTVNAIMELSCIACENVDLSVMTDAYLEECDTECEYEEHQYTELVVASEAVEHISAETKRADTGYENIRDILTVSTELRSLSKKLSGCCIEITGEAVVSGVACEVNEDNSISYLPVKFTSPFSLYVNCNCQIPENSAFECRIIPSGTEISIDSEKIFAKCALGISYRIYRDRTIKRLKSCGVCVGGEYTSKLSTVTVYYPEAGDTLFGIARKYHTTGMKIASDNSLSEPTLASVDMPSSLDGVKKLIIR